MQDDSRLMEQLEEAVASFDPATLAAASKKCTGALTIDGWLSTN